MRIIAGKFKNRRLTMPKSDSVRPTSSRLRETVFNICQGEIEGINFLDICAGSGAMGFEALSRGAAMVMFIEKDPQAVTAIKRNVELLGVGEQTRVFSGDFTKILPRLSSPFDIIFADPPYESGLSLEILSIVAQKKMMAEGGMLMIEEGARVELPETAHSLTMESVRKTGEARLWIYTQRN